MRSSRCLNPLIYCVLFVCVVLYIRQYSKPEYGSEVAKSLEPFPDNSTEVKEKKQVLIFAATKFFGHPITTERFLALCPEKKKYCQMSETNLKDANAVVFHNADYRPDGLKDILNKRNPKVPYVLWSLESPSNDAFRPGKDVINWTMTYRRDADVWAPYGHMEQLKEPVNVNLDEIWNSKNKSITMLVSNCYARNRRSDIVRKLEKGLKIDIWGSCGKPPPNCGGVDKQENECVVELIKPYKFYISIENSNCKDYVTEKFWKALNDRMVVPIVLARKYYRELGVPDSAYISIDDFSSISEFMAHIKSVIDDKEKYLKYHEWRKTWKVIIGNGFSGFCRLCDKLQIPNPPSKTYENVAAWHQVGGNCENSLADKFLK